MIFFINLLIVYQKTKPEYAKVWGVMDSKNVPRLLIIAPDVVGKKMAGPGIRYVEIAQALAPYMPVAFATGIEGSTSRPIDARVRVNKYLHVDELKALIDGCDVVFCQMTDRNAISYALSKGKRIIYDFYNVLPVETIGAERISGYTKEADKDREFIELLSYFEFCSRTGSYFVCSNPRQRDYWLGFIMASRGILPSTLEARSLDQIIDFAPFGMSTKDPIQREHPLRDNKNIFDSDFLLIWAGGIWDWFDANTPIKAVAELCTDHPDIKLVFYGTSHPNKKVGTPKNVKRAKELASELGVLDRQVFFQSGWVDFDDRANYLLEADVAISSHVESLETSYAFRTRILDHFWAKLPSIVTTGDWFADYIEERGLGLVTNTEDVESTKHAILKLYKNKQRTDQIENNINKIRADWTWTQTTEKLRDYLLNKVMYSPVIAAPTDSFLPRQTITGSIKRSRGVNYLRKTKVWPHIKKAKSRLSK